MTEQAVMIHNVKFSDNVPSGIQRVATDRKTDKLAVLRADGCLELWDTTYQPHRQKILQVRDEGSVECLTWCNGRLFSGNLNGCVTEHPLTSDGKRRIFQLTGGPCWCLAANDQQTMIVAGSEGGYVTLFTLQEDNLYMERILESLQCRVLGLSWLASGSHVVAACEDKLYVTPLAKGQSTNCIKAITKSKKTSVPAVLWCVLVLPDFTIVTGDSRGMVAFYNADTASLICGVMCLRAAVQALALSPNGEIIYVTGVEPVIVQVKKNKNTNQWFKAHIAELHSHDVKSLAVDRRNRVYSGGDDTHLGMHYFPPKVIMKLAPCPIPGSNSCASDYLLLSHTTHIEWWRLGSNDMTKDRVLITRIECPEAIVLCCALSPSGRRAAYCCAGKKLRIRELHLPSGSREARIDIKTLQGQPPVDVCRLMWITDDSLLVLSADNALQIWNIDDSTASYSQTLPQCPHSKQERDVNSQPDHDVLHLAAASPTVILVATASSCVVHDLEKSTANVLPLHKHNAPITAVCGRSVTTHKKKSNTSSTVTTAAIAYSDMFMVEYDVETTHVTPLGKALIKAKKKQPPIVKPVIRGLSWNKAGTVLCLHSDIELMFINEQEVLSFDWNQLPSNKKMIMSDNIERKRLNTETSNNILPDSANSSDLFVPKRKRSRIFRKVDLETEVWKSLIKVEKKSDSWILGAKFTSDNLVPCIELTSDHLLSKLSQPFAVPKFGTK